MNAIGRGDSIFASVAINWYRENRQRVEKGWPTEIDERENELFERERGPTCSSSLKNETQSDVNYSNPYVARNVISV